MSEKEDIYYTPQEVSSRLKVSISTVYNLLKSHEIEAVRVGRSWRIPPASIDKYLHSNTLIRDLRDGDR